MIRKFQYIVFFTMLSLWTSSLPAQLLEPRALTNIPIGMNFIAAGYGYSSGNILLDPAVPIEDLEAGLHTGLIAYVRGINLFGNSAKINIIVPYAAGDWSGRYNGIDTTTARNGLGDISIQFSMNFFGAPALEMRDFVKYEQDVVVGASVRVFIPVGQYYPDKLINLGSNRWTFRPQVGMSWQNGSWIYEAYVGAWFYTTNTNFFGGNTLAQEPLFTAKLHLIRTLKKGIWFGIGAGYGVGGRTIIEDVVTDTKISTLRFGAVVAVPVAAQHSFKLAFDSGVRLEKGPDFESVALLYQYRFGGN